MTPVRFSIPTVPKGRLGVLDELKGVAIILIICYHGFGVLSFRDILHPEVGVDMFVILSGIGLGLSRREEPAGKYLLRRFLRIYPTYWFVLAAIIFVNWWLGGGSYGWPNILFHVSGFHAFFGDAYALTISDPLWYISLVVGLYVVYMPLRRFRDRLDLLLLGGAALSVAAILGYFFWGQGAIFSHLALRVPGFFVGLLIGQLMRQGQIEVPVSPALGASFFLLFYITYAFSIVVVTFIIGLAVMAGYALLLRPVVALPVRSAFAWLGVRSLAIFLIHQPILREYNVHVIARFFPKAGLTPFSLSVGMIVGLVVTLVLADVMTRVFERVALLGEGATAS